MCSLTHGKLRYRLSGHCALWRRVASDNRPPCGLPETLRRPVLFATENTPRNPHPPDACFPPPGNSESGLLPFGQMVRSVSRPSALGGPPIGEVRGGGLRSIAPAAVRAQVQGPGFTSRAGVPVFPWRPDTDVQILLLPKVLFAESPVRP